MSRLTPKPPMVGILALIATLLLFVVGGLVCQRVACQDETVLKSWTDTWGVARYHPSDEGNNTKNGEK